MQKIYLTTRHGLTYAVEAAKSVFKSKQVQPSVGMRHLRNFKTMGNFYLLAIACITSCFCSCKKESLSDDAMINSTSLLSASASAKQSGPSTGGPRNSVSYGALICPPTTGPGWLSFQQNIAE